jgi:hypothetical protein
VLRKTLGPTRYEVRGEWERLLNEKLRNLYSSQNIRVIKTRKLRQAGHVTRMEEMTVTYSVLMGKPEGKWST